MPQIFLGPSALSDFRRDALSKVYTEAEFLDRPA